MNAYNRLLKAHLLAIDDIMLFPINKVQAVAFFNVINHLLMNRHPLLLQQ